MAKRVTELGDDGKLVTYEKTRARKKSESQLVPWSEGPTTRRAKIARALWG